MLNYQRVFNLIPCATVLMQSESSCITCMAKDGPMRGKMISVDESMVHVAGGSTIGKWGKCQDAMIVMHTYSTIEVWHA